MPTSTPASATDRYFDSVAERQAAAFDLVRSATERYHRFNRSVIEGARQATMDWTEVGRRLVANPTDLLAVYEAASDAGGNARARALALAREWIEDRAEAQREGREYLRKGFGDVREVVERAQENAPQFLRRGLRTNGSKEPAEAKS
jgi:hypothetical protein